MYFEHRKMNLKEIFNNEINIEKLNTGLLDSNIYLIGTTLIDAGAGNNKNTYLKEFHRKNLSLNDISRIILTHEHYDHVGGIRFFKNARVLGHKHVSDLFFKEHPHTLHEYYNSLLPRKRTDIELKHGDKLRIGGLDFRIIHTPEHSKGSICLYNEKLGILFSGDLIPKKHHIHNHFIIDKDNLIKRLNKLNQLHINYIYPGHGEIISKGNNYLQEIIKELTTL